MPPTRSSLRAAASDADEETSDIKRCEHDDIVSLFDYSAACLDCGAVVCGQCRFRNCKVFFWMFIIRKNIWQGKALSIEDAVNTLNSAILLCRFRAGRPRFLAS